MAQSRTEVRLVGLLQGQNVRVGCEGGSKDFSAGECNCVFVSEGCVQEITTDHEGQIELFMVAIGLSDIFLLLSGNQSFFHTFLKSRKCNWLLEKYNLPLTIEQLTVIQQVLYRKQPVYLQPVYMQLKLVEWYVLFLERANSRVGKPALGALRPDEMERVRQVRNLLHNHPEKSYSLVGLAHAVGTNEATLKKHFKIIYGTTVFGYLTACRMERAKALLTDENLKVALVAQEVGYKYASHFSAAFRKYFGYLPTKILRKIISIPSIILIEELESVYLLLAV
ncbi:helix-turn-helix transcriptional regulator [Parapedobacter koreensis]|uniref:helix-turn-helix transcriptional regulator n=1 Tax=Parapedobacter koreensis TaxID=332977 RepID=UPI0015A5E5C7|nr:AraC family transcriptional regulator [Parapedobacter koreensis]